jgi:shikimate dehydrogenase
MRTFGLIGYPLTHSLSKQYFDNKFKRDKITDAEYFLFPLKNIDQFPDLLRNNPNLAGLNVTTPYKESIIKYIDEIDREAKLIGAVNTIKIKPNSNGLKLTGFNTDAYGFEKSLKPFLNPEINKALILGSGGASNAIKFVLKKLGISYIVVSREPLKIHQLDYKGVSSSIIAEHKLIINTTPIGMHPIGMHPNTDEYPDIQYSWLTPNHILFDLIYNPSETMFLKFGKEQGVKIINGLNMLHLQAEKSWKIWKK